MKVILFFCRFTFICNICFLLFVFFSWQEKKRAVMAGHDAAIEVPYFKSLIVTLGWMAIVINLIINIVCLFLLLFYKNKGLPKWLLIANFIFLLLQVFYFFLF